jgi:hypothetical protein
LATTRYRRTTHHLPERDALSHPIWVGDSAHRDHPRRRGDRRALRVHDKHRKFPTHGTWDLLLGPEGLQYEKYFRDRTSVWDGTADDINAKICEFVS